MARVDETAALFAEANPVPHPGQLMVGGLPIAPIAPNDRDDATMRDSDPLYVPTARGQKGNAWLIAALVAVAVLVGGVLGFVLASDGGPPATNGLAVVERLHDAMQEGDWEGIQEAYGSEATYTWVAAHGGDDEFGSLSSVTGSFPVVFAYSDWDGDGRITILDQLISNEMMQYANGRSDLGPCDRAGGDQVVCDQPAGGAFFDGPDPIYGGTWTYKVTDGLISHVSIEITHGGSAQPRARAGEFQRWIRETSPELEALLFVPDSPGGAWLTPENVEVFRTKVAEWNGG